MSLRRLHHDQPTSFAFTPANLDWAKGQIAKYPEGRQASAVIPLLWRGQEQEGWVTRPMIEEVARMLGMAEIRVLEVATFYFMFHLHPVGSVAHVQVCGTTSCMICGAEDLVAVCRERIAPEPGQRSADGRFSWEEVECLGACANAPMAQIGKDYYEDLDRESFGRILDALDRGEVPRPGSARGRFASEPAGGFTTLADGGVHEANGAVALAEAMGDTIARIDGAAPTASDILLGRAPATPARRPTAPAPSAQPSTLPRGEGEPDRPETAGRAETKGRPAGSDFAAEGAPEPVSSAAEPAAARAGGVAPERLDAPRGGRADDLKSLRGIGPKLEDQLNALGIWHLDQIAALSEANLDWLDAQRSGIKKVALREDWIATARALMDDKGGA